MIRLRAKLFWKVFLVALLLMGFFHQREVLGQLFFMEHPLVGKSAPEFRLPMTSGEEKSFSEIRDGKRSILFFWATWCPHCRKQLKELNGQRAQITAKNIEVILVDIGEEQQQVLAHLKKEHIDFNVFLDIEQQLADSYQLVGVPSFFFISSDGIVRSVKHALPSNYEEILSAP